MGLAEFNERRIRKFAGVLGEGNIALRVSSKQTSNLSVGYVLQIAFLLLEFED